MPKLRVNDMIILSGVVLGLLDWITDAAYASNVEFTNQGLKTAAVTFLIMQPLWYFFMFIVYIASHEQFESMAERKQKFKFAIHYTLLNQFKLLANFEKYNKIVYDKFPEKEQFLLFNLENSFRVQIGVELLLETIPQIIIQVLNNQKAGWGLVQAVSFLISILLLVKNISMVTVFGIRKFIEHRDSVSLRPTSYAEFQTVPKLDNASKISMMQYQVNPNSQYLDEEGNTETHQKIKDEYNVLQLNCEKQPQEMFMLNKHGQTPLDICIENYSMVVNLEKTIEPESPVSMKRDHDVQRASSNKVDQSAHRHQYSVHSRRKTGKIIDESTTQMVKSSPNKVELDNIEATYETKYAKALLLMRMMQRHSPQCSIKFLRHPQRLNLKFERSYTMAVKKNQTDILSSFPKNSIKTVYVSTSQLKDIRQFKAIKKESTQNVITTPLHLACQLSNVEAARILLTNHDYDINILLYEKNFIYDLLTTGGYQDFNILNNVFKKRKPCINSGCKIPINQAILRGNQYIIQTMLEHGNPNPYAKDINGFTPVHFACAKLDWETFEDLIKIGGDPLLPDHEGNTFMHLLCEGGIKDIEYDFAKMACQQFNLRLTRNNNGKSALDLLGSMKTEELYEMSENLLMKEVDNNLNSGLSDVAVRSQFGKRNDTESKYGNINPDLRGQPNYKSKLIEFLKQIRENDPTFEDHEGNSTFHNAIIKDDMEVFDQIIEDPEFITDQLNLRNVDGKSPLFLAIEHNRREMFDKLFTERFLEHLDLKSKDTIHGNQALHIACEKEQVEVATKIFEFEEELCMQPNYLGRSPFFVACQKKNLELLRIFENWKTKAIMVQDYIGENMLFVCAREGDVEIFNWFGGSNNFYRARGQQNYKGHTIEHIVCIAGKTGIVEEIRPKLDTKDYYGNLPLHYTIASDDEQMVRKYFTNGKAYFEVRNFKYETIFHTAAKHDSEDSMRAILGRTVFQEELLKRDFKGDTPLHTAAKSGSLKILQFFLTACTPAFLDVQNDFGLTPIESLKEKISLIFEKIADMNTKKQDFVDKLKMAGDSIMKNAQGINAQIQKLEKDIFEQQKKLEKTQAARSYIEEFDSFVTTEEWNKRFEVPLAIFLEMCVDPNLRVFMGMNTRTDLQEEEADQDNKKIMYSPSPANAKVNALEVNKDLENQIETKPIVQK